MERKVVAMIPARMGSQRVAKKSIRLINGKPMMAYVIEAAKAAGCFDEIYVNSESDVIGQLAEEYGVKFYKRPEELSSNTATNDEFVHDFLNNVDCSHVVQILPTSPFISPEEIRNFTEEVVKHDDAVVSVKEEQISCVFGNKPINFDRFVILPPSQEVTPVKVYATSLMGWSSRFFKHRMEKVGAAYHGQYPTYFTLKGYSTIDVDNEEDFLLAEVVAQALESEPQKPQYYQPNMRYEADVPDILKKDGVMHNDLFDANNERVNVLDIIAEKPKNESWSKRLVDTESNSATLISQMPSEGNRRHYHDNWNEWWYIVDGEWEWEIEGEKMIVKKNDLVFIEKGKVHKITAIGDKPAIRLAVSRADVNHIYQEE